MYTAYMSSGNMAALYFVILNVVGNYMVLNMFLAILLARFEEPDDDDEGESGAKEGNSSAKVVPEEQIGSGDKAEKGDDEMQLKSKSLFIFDVDHPLRVKVFNFVKMEAFDNFILLLIVISGILLAIDEPYVGASSDSNCGDLKGVLSELEYEASCGNYGFSKTLSSLTGSSTSSSPGRCSSRCLPSASCCTSTPIFEMDGTCSTL